MKKIIIPGIVIGALNFAWLLAEFFSGLHSPNSVELFSKITMFSLLIPIIGIIMTYRNWKRTGIIAESYKKRFLDGLKLVVVITMVSILGQLLYHIAINPDYLDGMIEYAKLQGHKSPEALFNIPTYLLQVAITQIFIGIIVSLITGAVFKFQTRQSSSPSLLL